MKQQLSSEAIQSKQQATCKEIPSRYGRSWANGEKVEIIYGDCILSSTEMNSESVQLKKNILGCKGDRKRKKAAGIHLAGSSTMTQKENWKES